METLDRTEVDGAPATPAEIARVTSGYGHFTAMQVRHRATRGLALHLERLARANRERFGVGLDEERIRELILHGMPPCAFTCTSPRGNPASSSP
jgi:hypothetical protein